MARKIYSLEFKKQAVDLYESAPGATLKGIAGDLGIGRHTLKLWVDDLGSGSTGSPMTTSSTGSKTNPGSRSASEASCSRQRPESQAARIARLDARVQELEASEEKLATERDILRQAAKFFAQETDW